MAKIPIALGGVILLIFGMRALGKKMVPGAGAARTSRAVQVLVRSTVSPRQQLMLIQVGRRLVLVGNSGAEMNALCQIDDPDEVAEVLGHIREDKGSSVAKNFRTLFSKAGKAYEPPEDDVNEPVAGRELSTTAGTRAELTGLTEQVRRITEQFRET
jgi:flagellar biogenesis protein FliO